ncbi:hypothetical protein E6H28_01145 [Candidatus Bathyarchaeota archaeon]|nr:MAG: hypothetical protein E6H28_01145 [Candidatus Bathyarchaeota archaeon]
MPGKLVALFVLVSLVMLGLVANRVEAQGTCGLQYKVVSRGASYPGATVTLVNKFTNAGSLAMQVTSITVTVDFGTFSAPSSKLPLSVAVGTTQELDFDAQVPSSTSVGSHPVSASAAFQCNESGSWVTPSFSPLVLTATFEVGQNPGTSTLIGVVILGAIAALAVAVVVLVVKLRRRKQVAPQPPPAYTPPPQWGPPPPPPTNP